MRIPFEGENVCADPVEDEAVVADDHGTPGEIDKRVFQGTQGFHVEIVGRLVKE